MICWKNKSGSSGFQHNKEGSEILVKCQAFGAAVALQKSALEKEDNDYLLAEIGFSEVEEIITYTYYCSNGTKKNNKTC